MLRDALKTQKIIHLFSIPDPAERERIHIIAMISFTIGLQLAIA
jgi:hypothetical protein